MAAQLKKMPPEQIAADKALMDETSKAILKGLAKDNEEIFGTPIPEHLKD